MAAWCTPSDLLTGDIPLAGKYGDGTAFINLAADEIDSQIGHIYTTPIIFDESTPQQVAKVRPQKLLLKKINILLASGRIILDMAAGQEDDRLHAYGRSMTAEALKLLERIMSREIKLTEAPLLVEEAENENTAVSIINEDDYSLVGAFYNRMQHPAAPGFRHPAISAYTNQKMP